MASLSEIRARLQAQENRAQNKGPSQSDNTIYPFWNMPDNATATVRFLQDADPTNEWGFWVERNIIKLPFNGVKGKPDAKQVIVQVPCVEMFGENCPILAEVRPWYKDETLKSLANKYWKKRSYLMQGFVRANPLGDDHTPANPIRRLVVTSQLHTIIKAALIDPEVEEMPTDYVRGLDFNIRKIPGKSGYPEYTTSSWARKESPLTESELAAIEAHGLFNLADSLPKKPSEAELRVIKEMFEASVDGRPYDLDKWGAYQPYGLDLPEGAAAGPTTETAVNSSPVAASSISSAINTETHHDEVPFEADEPIKVPDQSTSSEKAADILAMIRNRNKA